MATRVKSLQFPTIPKGLDKELSEFLTKLKDHVTTFAESSKKAHDIVAPSVKTVIPDASRMNEGEILWVDDGAGDPAGYVKINGEVVRIGGGNFNIDISTLKKNGDVWGFSELNVTVANAHGLHAALYLKSDGTYALAKADAVGTMPCSALALVAGSGVVNVFTWGYVYDSGWTWTKGGLVYIDITTAGLLTQTRPSAPGNQVQIAGKARTTNILEFKPELAMVEII
jgi:hypothetical protein